MPELQPGFYWARFDVEPEGSWTMIVRLSGQPPFMQIHGTPADERAFLPKSEMEASHLVFGPRIELPA